MNKKKFAFLALIVVVIFSLSLCMLVACNTDDESDDSSSSSSTIEATEGLLISNGDFKVTGSTSTYPSSATGWSGAKMYSSGSYDDDVVAGVISLDKSNYDNNKSKWNDDDDAIYNLLTQGNRYDNDDIKNALMVYMPEEGTDLGVEDAEYGPTAYGYTSTSFSLGKSTYYKLSVDVLTYGIKADLDEDDANYDRKPGARIYVSSNTYAQFDGIDTNGTWQTYTIYIETTPNASYSLSVMLGLGNYSSYYTKGLTTGYAFFDNLSLEEVDQQAYDDAVAQELQDNATTQTTTLKVNNGRFDFGTSTLSSSSVPSGWSLVTGNSSENDPAPTSLGYNAIIDTSKFATNYKNYSSTFYIMAEGQTSSDPYIFASNLEAIVSSLPALPADSIGSNVYMLSQQLMTAQGIKSSRTITFEKNAVYALSINVYTYGVHGGGVSLILESKDGEDIIIKGISKKASDDVVIGNVKIDPSNNSYSNGTVDGATTGGWTTYTFYVQGNQFKDYSYNMSIWLGTDGTNSNNKIDYTKYSSSSSSSNTTYDANGTFANGWVFVDDLKLAKLDTDVLPSGATIESGSNTLDVSISGNDDKVAIAVNLQTSNLFDGTGNSLSITTTTAGSSIEGTTATVYGTPNGWSSDFDKTDSTTPLIEGVITDGLVSIESEEKYNLSFTNSAAVGQYPDMPYDIETQTAYLISANQNSQYYVTSAPFIIEANGYYRISLWVKTIDVKSSSGAYVYLINNDDEGATLSSFSAINTDDYDEYTNDWCELTFYVRGANEEDTSMSLKLALGTGNRWAASTITSGSVYFANTNMTLINYSAFSSATTGTYVKSVDMSSSTTYTFTNGDFDTYDQTDDKLDNAKALSEQTVAAKPSSWSISDDTLDANTSDSSLVAGVIALNDEHKEGFEGLYFNGSTQTSAILPDIDFSSFYGDETTASTYLSTANLDTINGANMLVIASTDSEKYAVGYTSNSFSLSSNNRYMLSVYVKTVGATNASVFLTGETSTDAKSSNYFKISNSSNSDWTKYTYYIEVGSASVSLKLNVWLGYDETYVDVDDNDEDAAKSSGAVFFDHVVLNSIDEDKYDAAEANDTTKKISFLTDSFDSLSSTISSRNSLSTANGWTGAADTNQTASNTKHGVIYADSNYLETDNDGYVTILGSQTELEDVTYDDDDIEAAREQNPDASDDELIEIVKQQNYDTLRANTYMPIDVLSANSGKQLLIINNLEDSAYTYTSSSKTLSSNSLYRISVWVRTYALSEGEEDGAYVELYLGSADEDDNPLIFKAIRATEWTEYVFYVNTLDDDVTSVTLKLGLGKYYDLPEDADSDAVVESLTSGYAMFDDVTVETVEEDFEAISETSTLLKREVTLDSEGTADDDEEEGDTTDASFNLEYLAWMIPTIVLGLLIIIVLIVFAVKKLKKPVKKAVDKAKASAAAASNESVDKKRSTYDSNKE